MKRKAWIGLTVGLISLAGVYYLASSVIPNVLMTAAKGSVGVTVSLVDSYVIGEKILAKADGEEKCRVNVFLTDRAGRAVPNKTVSLFGMEGIEEETGTSDKNGKVSFEMVSGEEGQFEIKASVEGVEMPQGVTVTFRN